MKALTLTYWRRLLAKEWLPMLISLGMAVALWYNVGGEKTVDTSVMIPVEVINLPRDLVISNQFKRQVEVTVNGPRSLILGIDNKAITRRVDLSTATPGTTVITNDNDSISVPRGVTVLRVQPSSIILSLDKLIQKKFPITPVTTGSPMPGYIIKGLRMDPDMITITGPETVLAPYDSLRTKAINVNDLNKSVQQQVPLDLDPSIVDLIGETTITADISVGLDVVMKEYDLALENSSGLPVQQVHAVVNVPRLLLDKKMNIAKMLAARVAMDEANGVGLVQVVPSPELSLPVEIVRVDPAVIPLPGVRKKQEEEPGSGSGTGASAPTPTE